MKKFKQIIALGGGGFSMEQDVQLLDNYILNATGKENPKICFFANAGGDAQDYIDKFYNVYNKLKCIPTHISLKVKPEIDLEKVILEQDVLFVGGGSTRSLMTQWKTYGLDKIMRKAYNKGIVLSGMSAGAIVWFSDGIFNPTGKKLAKLPCLGFMKGSFCPHYDERTELRYSFRELVSEGAIKDGYGVEDYCGLHFIEGKLYNVISSRRDAKAYEVKRVAKIYTETKLETVYLGDNYKEEVLKEIEKEKAKEKITEPVKTLSAFITENNNIKKVEEFINHINEHDIDKLLELMTDDHVMTDSGGVAIKSKNLMKLAWLDFFISFPDYTIKVEHIISDGDNVAVFGKAKGTYWKKGELEDKNKFEVPASWQAKLTEGKISEWRVFADISIVRQIMEANT